MQAAGSSCFGPRPRRLLPRAVCRESRKSLGLAGTWRNLRTETSKHSRGGSLRDRGLQSSGTGPAAYAEFETVMVVLDGTETRAPRIPHSALVERDHDRRSRVHSHRCRIDTFVAGKIVMDRHCRRAAVRTPASSTLRPCAHRRGAEDRTGLRGNHRIVGLQKESRPLL